MAVAELTGEPRPAMGTRVIRSDCRHVRNQAILQTLTITLFVAIGRRKK